MNTYTIKHKKISKYGNEPERTNTVMADNKLDAVRAFRRAFGGVNKVEIISVEEDDEEEKLEVVDGE